MGWVRKTAAAVVAVLLVGYAGLAWVTREPVRPVVELPVAGRLLLTDVTVVDPRDGSKRPGMSVLMEKGLIVHVGPAGSADAYGAKVVRGGGGYLVPGYNDMHAHPLGAEDPSGDLALMLTNGVTGFRQMSGSDAMLSERRELRLPTGEDAPAALALPGPLLTPLNASRAEQVRATIRGQKGAGADFVKVGMVNEPVLFAALAEGREIGIPVAGHVPAGTDILAAARRGMRAVEHLGPAHGLLIACSARRDALLAELKAQTRAPDLPAFDSRIVDKLAEWALAKRVINPAAADHEAGAVGPLKEAMASFDEAQCRNAMRGLKDAGNWQVPTLIRLKAIYFADDPAFRADPALRYVPPATVKGWEAAADRFEAIYPAADRAAMRKGYEASLRLVKMLDEEGVPMLAGSDSSGAGWVVPGFALHREFDELARAGLPPLRILQMTTSDAARFLGREESMGAIAPGMAADAVLLAADPTADAANLHRIEGVVHRGIYRDRAALDRLLERVAGGKGHLR